MRATKSLCGERVGLGRDDPFERRDVGTRIEVARQGVVVAVGLVAQVPHCTVGAGDVPAAPSLAEGAR